MKISTLGIITTIAGDSIAGFSGDGGAATAAELKAPYRTYVDDSGSIYIADAGNHRIRKVDTKGIIATIAGDGSGIYSGDGGLAINAGLSVAEVAIDKMGNIYLADGA